MIGSYLSNAHFATCKQEIFDVAPTLGHVQLWLKKEGFVPSNGNLVRLRYVPYHGGGRDVDGGYRSGLHVVGDVTQYDAVLQRKGKILWQRYPQTALDVLQKKIIRRRMAVVMLGDRLAVLGEQRA